MGELREQFESLHVADLVPGQFFLIYCELGAKIKRWMSPECYWNQCVTSKCILRFKRPAKLYYPSEDVLFRQRFEQYLWDQKLKDEEFSSSIEVEGRKGDDHGEDNILGTTWIHSKNICLLHCRAHSMCRHQTRQGSYRVLQNAAISGETFLSNSYLKNFGLPLGNDFLNQILERKSTSPQVILRSILNHLVPAMKSSASGSWNPGKTNSKKNLYPWISLLPLLLGPLFVLYSFSSFFVVVVGFQILDRRDWNLVCSIFLCKRNFGPRPKFLGGKRMMMIMANWKAITFEWG